MNLTIRLLEAYPAQFLLTALALYLICYVLIYLRVSRRIHDALSSASCWGEQGASGAAILIRSEMRHWMILLALLEIVLIGLLLVYI